MTISTEIGIQLEDKSYENVKTPLHTLFGHKVLEWKNETNSCGRRIVCGLALASLAIGGVLDMIASVALAILTSPGELAGYQYSRNFFLRVANGAITSLTFLTIFQYENIKGETLA